MLPIETLNFHFMDLLNSDLAAAHKIVENYITNRTQELYKNATDITASIGKVANIIEIHISAKLGGESRFGSIVKTEMELLVYDQPVTKLFDNLIKDVFDSVEDN